MRHSLNLRSTNFMRSRLRGLVIAVATALLLPCVSAQAASPAETFVQDNVQRGLAILSNNSLSQDQKLTQFRGFLLGLTDLNRTAVYTLGPVKNMTSPADMAAFKVAFQDYAFAVYETEFSKYSGQTLRVTGSVPHGPNDWLVITQLIDPHAESGQQPIEVDFRVFGSSGHFTVGDIIVLGLDLAITEQDEFQSFLSEHRDDVKALTSDLKQRAANVRSSGSISAK